jgi:hypothetical protein
MSPRRSSLWVVDRIEGRGAKARAVLVSDDGEEREVPRAELGDRAVEGAVLRVPVEGPRFEWESAMRNPKEERRRKDEAAERLKKLSVGDAGGDLEL